MKRIRYNWDRNTSSLYDKILKMMPIIDSHVHMGVDDDGYKATAEKIIKRMDQHDVSFAVIFPFNDPERKDDFHIPNERVYETVKKYPKRFAPFFRLDPKGKWKKEFKLRVEQGFVGVKLHTVGQKFKMDSKAAMAIYAECVKHNLPVVIHAGLGLSSVAKEVKEVSRKFPDLKLILAHAAFIEMDETIKAVKDNHNVYFDTSAIRIFDFYNLIKKVPSTRILFGTDYPYYNYPLAIEMLINACLIYKKPISSIKRIMGLNMIGLLKETDLFHKHRIKDNKKLKEKIEQIPKYDLYHLAKRSLSKLNENIKELAPPEDKEDTLLIIKYLKVYTLLNNAEVLLTKNSHKRAFNRIEIVEKFTREQFSRKEAYYTDLINKNMKRLLKQRKKIVPKLEQEQSRNPNFAKTNIRLAKNLCIQRILRLS